MNKKEVKKAPTLRFKGFTNDWEQHSLENLYNKIGNAFVGKATPFFTNHGHFYLESNNIKDGGINLKDQKFINDVFYIKQRDKWLHTNDLVMVQSGDVGQTSVITQKYNNCAAHALIMFRKPKNEYISNFLNSYFQSDVAISKIDKLKIGNTVNHLLASDMKTFKVTLPKHNSEAQKIIHIFNHLNRLQVLQQRKLKLLKVMKKALSQYMFCQEIEFVPILRFNSFSDKWKYERLKNLIVKEIKGKAKADMKGTKSTYIDTALLNGGSITKVDSPTDTFHNDIIILWDGSQAGKIYHGFTGALGSTLKSYKPKYSGGFLYQYLKSKEPIIFLRYRTPNIPHVVKDFTEIFKINVPSVKEQEKISKTLNYLDQSILVETKKIGSIKKIKKFLLQNMFI